MTENFLQINFRHQITDPGSSDNTEQNKRQNIYIQAYQFHTIENQRLN